MSEVLSGKLYVGSPLDLVQPETLRFKVQEPVALLGEHRFQNVDIRIRVRGGGHVSQVYGKKPSHENYIQENFDKRDKKKAQITFPLRHFFPLTVVK
jgi:small subunit ribosomal protein S16e